MSKPTDIRCTGTELHFLPVHTRMPLKFGIETVTYVTCARVRVTGGEVMEVTVANVPSYYLGPAQLRAGGRTVAAEVAYGGLAYAFVDAGAVDLVPLDRQPRRAPLREAVLEPARLDAALAQRAHRVEGHEAVRAPAVGDDFLALRQLREARLELLDEIGRAHV